MSNKVTFLVLSLRNRTVVAQIGLRLAKLHQTHRSHVERALHDYATNFWPSLGCPVFRGVCFAPAAKRVIGLLKALDVPLIRVVCFAAPDSAVATKWEELLDWPRHQMTFRHPPNGSSRAAQKWIAIDALFPVVGMIDAGHYKAAKGFSVIMRITALIVSIEQRRIKCDRRKNAENQEDNR
jgi:hypothetical protein